MTDIETTWQPSFCLVWPKSRKGKSWCKRNIYTDRRDMITVEHRYIADIVLGARADGLTVETTN